MSYRLLKSLDPWEIIIKDTQTNEEFSLMNKYPEKCPICYYPTNLKGKKECHAGLNKSLDKISYITGHYYDTDYNGKPNNWYSQLLKDISERPFKYSHEPFNLILHDRLKKADWDLGLIKLATMALTSNQQMEQLFSQLSINLGLTWISNSKLFLKNDLTSHYNNRLDYVNQKYSINIDNAYEIFANHNLKELIIFDDVLNRGYTFGRLIELLSEIGFKKFYLVSIARTIPKSFKKNFTFP